MNCEEDLIRPYVEYPKADLQDEILLRKLQNRASNGEVLDVDIAIINTVVKNKSYDKPYHVAMGIILERSSLEVIAWDVLGPEDTEESNVKQLHSRFIGYILSQGKPEEIKVRDKKMARIFEEFCNKLNIKIDVVGSLPSTDEFLTCISQFKF